MGNQHIPSLLIRMSLPLILSMVIQAVYNICDSFFVSRIPGLGDVAAHALALAYPVQLLMIAVALGTGVGVNAMLARNLGKGDPKTASAVAGNAVFLGVCTYLCFLLFGIFGASAYLRSQSSDPEVLALAIPYLRICCIFSFGVLLSNLYDKMLQSTGKTLLSMVTQISGSILHIVLDPILIFGYLGFPALGVLGAAVSTVCGQILAMLIGMFFHYRRNQELTHNLTFLSPKWEVIREVYRIGIPAIVMQAMAPVMTYAMNLTLGRISSECVVAYGIYFKIQQFAQYTAAGLNNASIPLVSYNYGKRNAERVRTAIRYGAIYAAVCMLFCAVVIQVFGSKFAGAFGLSDVSKQLCVRAIRIVTFGYLFLGFNMVEQGVLQALGKGLHSLLISFVRMLLVTVPLGLALSRLPNADQWIWIIFPIGELCGTLVALLSLRSANKLLDQLPVPENKG